MFKVIFKEALKDRKGSDTARVSGAVTFSRDREVVLPKVPAHSAFLFYMRNAIAEFADVQAPEFVTIEEISGERSRMRLRRSTPDGLLWMSFPPAVITPSDTNDEASAAEPLRGEWDVPVTVLTMKDALDAGHRKKASQMWIGMRRAKNLSCTKVELYNLAQQDKSEYYKWERGEIATGAQADKDIRRVLLSAFD